MKRVIALLLCLSFVLSFSNISVFAEGENYKFARIKVTANKKDYYETVIVDDDTLYMATESIAKYATYNTSKHKLFFMRRDQDDVNKAFKLAYYNESDNTIHVKLGMTWKTIKNVKCKVYQDSYYLPIHMVFPYLDSVVSTDKKSLIIESDRIALSDALYDYDHLDYYFNMSSEFADSALLATGLYLPSYLFDTSTKIFDWKALAGRLLGVSGNENDYLAAFESIVLDNKVYLKTISCNPNNMDEIYAIIDEDIALGKLLDNIREIDDFIGTTFEIGESSYEFLQFFKGFKDFKEYYDLVKLVYNYANMAEDHYDMIKTVYSKDVLKANNSFEKTEYKAGKKAALIYSNSFTAVSKAINDFTNSKKRDAALEGTIWDEMVDATGSVLKFELKLGYTEKVPLLPYYASIMNSSMSASTEYNMRMVDSKSSEDKMRLSEILYLLSSVKCYEVMLDVYDRYDDKSSVSYYQSQINKNNARLTLLYQAKNNTTVNYSDESKAIKKAIKSMSVKGLSEEEFKYKNLADWKWIIEPSVEADDIQPVRYGDYLYDKNGCHFNSLRAQVYDKLSIITEESDGNSNDEKYGLISYSGMKISSCNFDHIFFIDQYKDRFYVLGGEVSNKIINEHYEIDRKRQYDAPMEVQSYLRWIKDYNGLYECELGPIIDLNDKIVYNEPSAVIYTDKIKKVSKYIYEAISPDEYVVFVNNGRIVTEHIYEDAGCFSDGVIPLKLNGKWGYIDGNGKTILPFEFDSIRQPNVNDNIYDASNGYIVVKKDNQYAIFDVTGSLVINYGVFEEIRPVYEGMAWVKQDGKWGVIGLSQDVQGINVVAPKKTTTQIEATVSEKSGARLRQGPGTDYDVIGMISNNKKILVCGITDDWSYVKINKSYGWIKSDLIIKEIESVTLTSKPTKINYYVGDTLKTDGLKLKAKFVDKTEKEITSGFTCEPTQFSNAGTQTITVTYGDKKVTFDVNVSKAPSLPKLTNDNVADVLYVHLWFWSGLQNDYAARVDFDDKITSKKDDYLRFYRAIDYKTYNEYLNDVSKYIVIDRKEFKKSDYFIEKNNKLYFGFGDKGSVSFDLNSVKIKEYKDGAYYIYFDLYNSGNEYYETQILKVIVEDGRYKIYGCVDTITKPDSYATWAYENPEKINIYDWYEMYPTKKNN